MIKTLGTWTGNTLTFATATFATFTYDDLRLWLVAIAGLLITFFGNQHRKYKDKLEAQKSRQELCNACLNGNIKPLICVVKQSQRPMECWLKKF